MRWSHNCARNGHRIARHPFDPVKDECMNCNGDVVTISADLHAKLRMMMFRIYDESVPLFSSERLKNLHRDAGRLLEELDKQS